MSVDHKRPLLAFAVVTVACIVIMVNGVRSDAFVSALRWHASHVVSGLGPVPADHPAGHRNARTVEAATVVAAPVTQVRHLIHATPRANRAPAVLSVVPARGHSEAAQAAHPGQAHAAHGHAGHAGRHEGGHGQRAHGLGPGHGLHLGHGDHLAVDVEVRGPAIVRTRLQVPVQLP